MQTVIRPQSEEFRDYRGYAEESQWDFRKSDNVTVLPSGFTSTIKSINLYDKYLDEVFAPMSVTISLEDDIDISRGDTIVKTNNQPSQSQDLDVMLCWLNNNLLDQGLNIMYAYPTIRKP